MSSDLTPRASGALTAPGTSRRGFEEPTAREDIIIPRAKLLQALSPEIVDGVEGCKVGMIYNSATREALPDVFIPVFKFTNWVRFNPRDKQAPGYDPAFGPGDVIWRSSDPADPRVQAEGKFGDDGTPPLATKFLNFFSVFPGIPMPIIVSFSKTSFKAGKQLLSLASFTPGDMFSRKYRLKTRQIKGDKGTYFVLDVEPAGRPTDEEFAIAEKYWNEFSSKASQIQVHDEADSDANGEQAPF